MSTSGTTDRAGRHFGVSLRELAQDLGIPNPWRKWTLDGWVEEMAKLAGARLERLGQEAPPELRVMAARVLVEGGVVWAGGAP